MRRSNPLTFDDKLNAEKARIEAEMERIDIGPQRDLLEHKLRQIDTAFQVDKWLSSPELQPPK
jgi:hypothetical protein